jgi:hypothetical protein
MSRLHIAFALVAASSLSLTAQQQTARAAGDVPRVGIARARQYVSTTIQGNALDSTNAQMRNVLVRLRDARFGRIVDTQLTDKAGLFAFKGVDPGSYIVELLAQDESILAASQLLNVNAGDAVSAVVKLPFRIPPYAGAAGGTATSSLAVIATQAVASGIAAVVPTRPVSPNQ